MNDFETQVQDEAAEMAKQISMYLNCYGSNRQNALIDSLLLEHRTLQQGFTRLCMRWMERLAEAPHGYDLRNEASVKLAQRIMAIPRDERILPLI